ncbi:SusD/RagB family nutrient-binding outer membrane lipoprotein [Hymenobacter sp. BT730]|uniref:SusD/RagB family nutrient-binding outer membrane lipoprotein n=1 Tax=Hymenobacter sp. BT730 TaxID=3063332 RepID=UPI0026E039F5|nr:SusD/RagB family nutrient-binding outer membrane lipoprotein [Hymenobacter sp. BT730]
MKKRLAILLASALLVGQTGCNLFTDGYDISPNSASTATLPLLMSGSQLELINIYTGQIDRISNVFIQRLAGTDQQYATYATYNINETDTNNDFDSIYQGGLINAQNMIDQATAEGSPYYVGIGKIMKAMLLGIATDVFGDIPNREALQGKGNFNPAYDSQEIVLQDIQTLLSEGITELQKPASSNKNQPRADDLIFNGNIEGWIKTAWIVKARYANRLSRRDPSGSATQALEFLDAAYAAGLNSSADDAKAPFGGTGSDLNQFYAFNNARPNYVKMGARLVDLMQSLNDPRLAVYATEDTNGEISGTPLGTTDQSTSDIGEFFASPAASIPMVTYVEAKFIEAEAALRLGQLPRAQAAYTEAITAHFNELGVQGQLPAYLAANGTLSGTNALAQIMTQKYIATFLQLEGWADYRRTKLPVLTPDPTGIIDIVPERLPTSQNERVNNKNATVVQDLTVPVYWAQP